MSNLLPGSVLAGRYRLIRQLDSRGSADICLAVDLSLQRQVVLKFLPAETSTAFDLDPTLAAAVDQVRQVASPHICRLWELHKSENRHFLAMEAIDGEFLRRILERELRFSPAEAAELGVQIFQGLEALHRSGVLHEVLGPDQIMLDGRRQIRLVDGGLAALLYPQIPPEQLRGEPLTVQTDIFSATLVLIEMITGESLFSPDSEKPEPERRERLLARHCGFEQERLLPGAGLPPDLEAIFRSCLDPDPDRRPRSALEVARALREWLPPRWSPSAGAAMPGSPDLILKRGIELSTSITSWLAVHRLSGEVRILQICRRPSDLPAFECYITRNRRFRELARRTDRIARVCGLHLGVSPAFLELEMPGNPLSDWIEERGGWHEVPFDDRLEIFLQAADAVAELHTVGMAHLDLCPATFFVLTEGETLRVTLRDVGPGQSREWWRRTSDIMDSELGAHNYRAPSFFDDCGGDLGLRSDVYSLGVVLYQLVVGDFQRDPGDLKEEIEDRTLRHEIEMALQPAAAERFSNAAVLAARIRNLKTRHRRREEIECLRAETARLMREKRRADRRIAWLKGGLAASAVLWLILLVIGIDLSRDEQVLTESMSRIVTDILETSNPVRGLGASLTADRFLDTVAYQVEDELSDYPGLQARARSASARANLGLGRDMIAAREFELALTSWRANPAGTTDLIVDNLHGLAETLRRLSEYSRAEDLIRKILRDDPEIGQGRSPRAARVLRTYAGLQWNLGRYVEAEALYNRILDRFAPSVAPRGPEHLDLVSTLNDYGSFLLERERVEEAEHYLLKAHEICRTHPEHPPLIAAWGHLGDLARVKGDFSKAGHFLDRALNSGRKRLGSSHPEVASLLSSLAKLDGELGNFDQAEARFRESLEMKRMLWGEQHPQVADCWRGLGRLSAERGQYETAAEMYGRAVEILETPLGPSHPKSIQAEEDLAPVLSLLGRRDEAEHIYRMILWQRRGGAELFKVTLTRLGLAEVLIGQERLEEAEELQRQSASALRLLAGRISAGLGRSQQKLARLRERVADPEGALYWYGLTLETFRELAEQGRIEAAEAQSQIARLLVARGDSDDALTFSQESLEILNGLLPPRHWRIASAKAVMGACLSQLGHQAEADLLLEEALADLRRKKSAATPEVREAERLLALYHSQGRDDLS